MIDLRHTNFRTELGWEWKMRCGKASNLWIKRFLIALILIYAWRETVLCLKYMFMDRIQKTQSV